MGYRYDDPVVVQDVAVPLIEQPNALVVVTVE
jgi:hypothetical protein